ncbi:MAG TPA: class II glutamine amidotransferase, partial [Paenirhodobacter sp.]
FMHNGQIGGYDAFRRGAEMMIPDDLYACRRGATDSEALFLVAIAEGLRHDPKGALERATARFEALARARGHAPYLRLTAALSDGERLYAVRYSSDDQAPTLYHRWSDSRGGQAVVSEPLEDSEQDWTEIPQGSFCVFEGADVRIEPFRPLACSIAA